MARRERYVVGLDVGTSKVAAIVGEMMEDGTVDIIGIGLADSKGIRRGVVNNVDTAAEAIKKALDEAELTAGVEIDTVISRSPARMSKHSTARRCRRRRAEPRDHARRRQARDRRRARRPLPSGREISTCFRRISSSTTRTASRAGRHDGSRLE